MALCKRLEWIGDCGVTLKPPQNEPFKVIGENKIGNTSHSRSTCEGRSPNVIDASVLHVRQDTKPGHSCQNRRRSNPRLDNTSSKVSRQTSESLVLAYSELFVGRSGEYVSHNLLRCGPTRAYRLPRPSLLYDGFTPYGGPCHVSDNRSYKYTLLSTPMADIC